MTVAELQARVSADTSQAERALENLNKSQKNLVNSSKELANAVTETGDRIDASAKKSSQSWQNFESNIKSVSGHLTTLGAGLSIAITAPIIGLGREALNTAVRFDSLGRGMTAVMKSSEGAKDEIKELREVAKLPGLGMEEAEQGSINLQAAGLSAKTARESLMAFGNALATVGKGKFELEGVNLALTQIATTGKVMGQEIRQLQQRVPQIRQIMLDAFGSADTEVLQRAGVLSKDFITIIVKELSKLPKVTGGVKNDIENLSDDWKLTLNEMGIALFPFIKMVSDTLVPIFHQVTDALKAMSPEQKSMIVWAALAVAAIGPVVTGLGLMGFAITNLIGLWFAFLPIATSVGTVIAALSTGPIAILIIAIGALFLAWKNNWGGMQDTVNNTFSSFRKSFGDWSSFAVNTWREWTGETKELLAAWGPTLQPILTAFKSMWNDFWFIIGTIVTGIFTGLQIVIDTALGVIRGVITAGMNLLHGDWRGAWKTIEDITINTWERIKNHTKSAMGELGSDLKSWWGKLDQKVNEQGGWFHKPNAEPITGFMGVKPVGMGGLRVAEKNLSPIHTFTDNEMSALGKKWKNIPSMSLPPAMVVGKDNLSDIQSSYRKSVSDILNQPKKTKLTDEVKDELGITKQLTEAKRELALITGGISAEMAKEIASHSAANVGIALELATVNKLIAAEKEKQNVKKKSLQDLIDEQSRFHDSVKSTEAAIRDIKSGNKENSLTNEFPSINKSLIVYLTNSKQYLQHLKDVKLENDRFGQSLAGVNAEILGLTKNDSLAKLKTEFRNLISNEELQKLADANSKLRSLQLLKSANDKLELLQMPKRDREAATAVGLELWKSMSEAVKNNTLAIFDNIHANDELAKSLEKVNDQSQKRVETLSNFVETMQSRLHATQAEALGDNATGAWERLLNADSGKLRDMFDIGPTSAKTEAMKMFFDVFNAEAKSKNILDIASAMERFNSQMEESVKLSQIRLSGNGNSIEAEWQKFLLNNKNMALKFKDDINSEREAFENFKKSFNLNREADYLEQFQSNISDSQKQFLILNSTDPFERFKASMLEIKNGELMQPFTEDQLKQMFKYQTIVDLADQMQNIFENAFSNLKDGFGAFFSTIVQGFEKMLQDMAAKWLASQLVSLVMRVLDSAFGINLSTAMPSAKALGGPVTGGKAYLVGERGPELFVPNNSGNIVPNGDMKGNETHIYATWNISTPDVAGVRKSRTQMQRDAMGLLGSTGHGKSVRGWG